MLHFWDISSIEAMIMIQCLGDLPQGDCWVHFVTGTLGMYFYDCIKRHHEYASGGGESLTITMSRTSGQSDWNSVHLLSTSIPRKLSKIGMIHHTCACIGKFRHNRDFHYPSIFYQRFTLVFAISSPTS